MTRTVDVHTHSPWHMCSIASSRNTRGCCSLYESEGAAFSFFSTQGSCSFCPLGAPYSLRARSTNLSPIKPRSFLRYFITFSLATQPPASGSVFLAPLPTVPYWGLSNLGSQHFTEAHYGMKTNKNNGSVGEGLS